MPGRTAWTERLHSADGAATWKKVSDIKQGAHFGFPVAVDAENGKTAWVVPGKTDMQRTTIDDGLFVTRTQLLTTFNRSH